MTIIACNCCIIDSDGNTQVLSEDAEKTDLPETTRKLLEHAQWVSIDVVNVRVELLILGVYRARSCALIWPWAYLN